MLVQHRNLTETIDSEKEMKLDSSDFTFFVDKSGGLEKFNGPYNQPVRDVRALCQVASIKGLDDINSKVFEV